MAGQALQCVAGGAVTHLEHSGHICLGNGSVLRLDFEQRQWVASMYSPDLSLRAYKTGGFEACRDLVNTWSDAYTASLIVGVGERQGAVPMPAPCQSNLGEIA
jgi:hypothetical protein